MRTSVVLAGDITDWIDSTTSWVAATVPVVFLTVVFVFGVWLMVVTRGGIRKLVLFAVGAALVYMLLTNVDALGGMFSSELRSSGAPASPALTVVRGREA